MEADVACEREREVGGAGPKEKVIMGIIMTHCQHMMAEHVFLPVFISHTNDICSIALL